MRSVKPVVAILSLLLLLGSSVLFTPTVLACNTSNIYLGNNNGGSISYEKVYGPDGNNGDTTRNVNYGKTTDIEQGETKYFKFKLTISPGCGSYYEAMFRTHYKPDGWIVRIIDNTTNVGKPVGTNIDGVYMGSLDSAKEGFSGTVTYYCDVIVTCPVNEDLGTGPYVEIEVYTEDRACNDADHIYVKIPFRVVERHDPPVVTITSPGPTTEVSESTELTYTATDTETNDADLKIDLLYKFATDAVFSVAKGGQTNSGTITWDCSSLKDGTYLVRVKASDDGIPRKFGYNTVELQVNNPNPPELTLITPGEDEELTHQLEMAIQWEATDEEEDDSNILIDLYYSMGSVSKWNEIVTDEANDGEFIWNISEMEDRPDYRVKVVARDSTGLSSEIYSRKQAINNLDGPVVSNLYPTGGQTFSGEMTIYWTAADADQDPLVISILFSTDGGENYDVIAESLPNCAPCSYKIDTTQYIDAESYMVRVEATDGELTGSRESELFTIFNNDLPEVSILGPSSGAKIGGIVNITWDATDVDADEVLTVDIFKARGEESWWPIVTDYPNVGYYMWDTYDMEKTIGEREKDGVYKFRAIAYDSNGGQTETIITGVEIFNPDEPTIDLVSPEGGDEIKGTYKLKWNAHDQDAGENPTVTLSYAPSDNASNIYTIAENLPTVGEYSWDTTTVPDGLYTIRAAAWDGVFEFMDLVFDVEIKNYVDHKPIVTISNPATGAMVMGNITIEWTATDANTEDSILISILYSTDGNTFEAIVEDMENSGSYTWDTTTVSDGDYFIKVVGNDGNGNDGVKMVGTFLIENYQEDKNPGPSTNQDNDNKEEGSMMPVLVGSIVALVLVLVGIIVGVVLFLRSKKDDTISKPLPSAPPTQPKNQPVSSGPVSEDPFGNNTVDDMFK